MATIIDTYHVPVLLEESVGGLDIKHDGTYVDVTFGGGGHSRRILQELDGGGHLYSFDQDADAEKNVSPQDNFTFVRSNFRYLKNWMRYYGVDSTDCLPTWGCRATISTTRREGSHSDSTHRST